MHYSKEHWGAGASGLIQVFIKSGSTIKFKNKTGFAPVSQELLKVRLSDILKKTGIRFQLGISWDYLAISLYVPDSIDSKGLTDLLMTIFEIGEVSDSDLKNAKNKLLESSRYRMDRRYTNYPLISFMVHHSSVYSSNVGDTDDIKSITKEELRNFISCYLSINNAVIITSSYPLMEKTRLVVSKLKPCFKSDDYSLEKYIGLDLPIRTVNHLKSDKRYQAIRMGFYTVTCEERMNVVYDLLSEIINNDEEIGSVSDRIHAQNNCYKGLGVFEINISDLSQGTNPDDVVKKLFDRFDELRTIELDQELLNAKKSLRDRYMKTLNSKSSALYALGKSLVLCGSKDCLCNYTDIMARIGTRDIKRVLKGFCNDASYKMFIKMEP